MIYLCRPWGQGRSMLGAIGGKDGDSQVVGERWGCNGEGFMRGAQRNTKAHAGRLCLRTESGLIGPLQKLQGDKCFQRPPPTCVGALLRPRFPNILPFRLGRMPSLTSFLPYLCPCASFACTFIPTALSQPALPIFSHNLREKVQKNNPPRSALLWPSEFSSRKGHAFIPLSLCTSALCAQNTPPHFLLVKTPFLFNTTSSRKHSLTPTPS